MPQLVVLRYAARAPATFRIRIAAQRSESLPNYFVANTEDTPCPYRHGTALISYPYTHRHRGGLSH